MKKRTVKDFIALDAPKDEEKLVLIQDGVSADKTFLDTFWAAHTHALAMADVQTGQVISGRCYLSWPLTDKERDAGDYSKRFTKGQIYRTIPSGLPRARSTGSKPAAGKVMPSTNLSGMSRRYWRKVYLVRHWRRFGRSTQSPFFWRTKCWGPSRWIVK